jgi:hypothetical protein
MEHHQPKRRWHSIVPFAQLNPSPVMDLDDDNDMGGDEATICANSAAPGVSLDETERERPGFHEGAIFDIDWIAD